MSDAATWHTANEQHLAAALAWLRLSLARLAGPEPAAMPEPPAAIAAPAALARPSGWFRFAQPSAPPAPPALPAPAAPSTSAGIVTDDAIAQAAAALAAAEAVDPPPALQILSQRLGLSPFEREILLLCAAVELDTRIAPLCARAQGDPSRPFPTFALALALFRDPAWDSMSPDRPLRFWRLIEINQPGAQPLTTSPLRADERIVNYIKGLNYLDDRLRPLLAPVAGASHPDDLPSSQRMAVETIASRLEQAAPSSRLPIVQLLGPDASSKQLIAASAAAALNMRLYRLPLELLPTTAAELEMLARLWQRESILLPIGLYLDALDSGASGPGDERSSILARFLARIDGVIFLDTREARPGLDRETLALDIARPTAAEQRAAWVAALGPAAGDSPARLAGQFNLSVAEIWQIAASALANSPADQREPRERVWELCLINSRPRLDTLVQRIDVRATWDDIVLPPAELALLRQIAAQVEQRGKVYDDWGFGRKMNRGKGISALFSGDSGTGKTMAAEVIADDLGLNLYRIDLSQVVSKYIGETEKNLRRLFDAAEDGGALLFFDEADALFGKRSEVKDSHDRYANIEVNYLLQRMEAYRGLAILATNMKSALDPAFLRRLRFVVNFPFPSVAERKQIWQKVFPLADPARGLPGTPTAGLDYDHLARLNLAGGNIHNIALNAAFLAAQAGVPVSMQLILEAARIEFRKIERPINEADFRWKPLSPYSTTPLVSSS
jgi:hypothetical protein